ncbi:MAG: hypothetical protein ABI687_06455 [Flavitalea sp.]
MKKNLLSAVLALLLLTGALQVSAQKSAGGSSYTNGLGLGIDFGDGSTLVGVSGKHFFSENNVGQAEIMFGDHVTYISAYYLYHRQIENAAGLRWFLGFGGSFALYKGGSNFLIRPVGGLDYKINNVPLAVSFDWRPAFRVTHDADFNAARFGLGFRYTFN